MRSLRGNYICLYVVGLYAIICYVFFGDFYDYYFSHSNDTSVNWPNIVLHLDLKGAPPKLSYLISLLPMIKKLGVTGLLIEYEDTFPYNKELVNISAQNCYRRGQLKQFLKKVVSYKIEIIPLIQTFGHMEHVLKLKEFKHLREDALYPDSICETNIQSKVLIINMLHQIIDFHSKITSLRYIHLGCDEVYHINKCPSCLKLNLRNNELILEHIGFLKKTIKEFSPELKILVWDDMLKNTDAKTWAKHKVDDVESVAWKYTKDERTSYKDLLGYQVKSQGIWIATAFKGADGQSAAVPDIEKRILNHISWLNTIHEYKHSLDYDKYNFRGIMITGWSRYSHMDPLAELLPVSMPSLVINLLLINKFKDGILERENITENLQKFVEESIGYELNEMFRFNGSKIPLIEDIGVANSVFKGAELYGMLKQSVLSPEDIRRLEYYEYCLNVNCNLNLRNVLKDIAWSTDALAKLNHFEKALAKEMKKYYGKYTIKEYVHSKTYEVKLILLRAMNIMNNYTLVIE